MQPIYTTANAFGLKLVVRDDARNELRLVHEMTEHGRQSLDPERALEPLGYYHRAGPLGDVLATLGTHGDLAVVGLGAGAMAAYAHPGQRMVFLEIDPDVVRIARDIGHFSYLARSLGRIEVRVGDGLATLNAAQGEQFQLIIVDAYDENSVPDHLVSADALATYTARLAPGGAVVLAATHPRDAVWPVVQANAQALGLSVLTRFDQMSLAEEQTSDLQQARFVVVAPDQAALAPLAARPGWTT